MRDDLPILTPHERALLLRFRADQTPSAAVAARVHRNLDALLASPASAASPIAWWHWARAGLLSVAIAASTLVVMGGTARVLVRSSAPAPMQAEDRAPTPTPTEATTPAPVAPATVPARAPVVDVAPAPAVELPSEPIAPEIKPTAKPPRVDRAVAKPTPEAAPVANDAAEIALFGEIKRSRDDASRLAGIARYRQTFPRGTFAAEIGVLEIEALCALGRNADADARAKEFLPRFPDSAYAAIARRGCDRGGK
jgi:hypothetical protein